MIIISPLHHFSKWHNVMHKMPKNCNIEQGKNTDGKRRTKMITLNNPNFGLFLFFSHDFFIGLKKDY